MALISGFIESIRSRCACTTSTGDTSFDLMRSASSVASEKTSSAVMAGSQLPLFFFIARVAQSFARSADHYHCESYDVNPDNKGVLCSEFPSRYLE